MELVHELDWIADGRGSLARASLKWILENEAVTSVIPGFRSVKQVEDNLAASDVKAYTPEELERLQKFYDEQVHSHIRGVY